MPFTIGGINLLPPEEKRKVYARMIPPEMLAMFNLCESLFDAQGHDLLQINGEEGSAVVEVALYHPHDAQDALLYGQFSDTINGQIDILFYAINDPASARFDVDRMPDGRTTMMGAICRNLAAEEQAMQAGLAPGQIRRGLRLLSASLTSFREFVRSLGHTMYFAEPLHYHNALIFEKHGFSYQQGRALIEHIHAGFAPGGELINKMDLSTPFRRPEGVNSLRLRSWAIYDGILGEPFTNVTMYRMLDKSAEESTCGRDFCSNLVW